MDNFSLYIHIPYCFSKCDYCDFFSIPSKKIDDKYIECLCNEIVYKSKKYKKSECNTIYIGGGTPSLLSSTQLKKISDFIFTCFNISSNYEFTVELNPDDVSETLLKSLEYAKVNRLSLGLQSMSDDVLKFIHRRANRSQNFNAIKLISRKWKGNVSFDFICGLPYEKKESFLNNLEEVLAYNPDHISLYSLCVEEETVLGNKICNKIIEYDYDFSDELWLCGKDLLEKNGYFQYEVSNFSIKGFECKHNLAYWNHKTYIGIGCGATGTEYNNDGTGIRITNIKELNKYIEFWQNVNNPDNNCMIPIEKEVIDLDTSIFEFFMMGLRKKSGVSHEDFYNIFQKDIPQNIIELFEKWQNKSLAEIIIKDNTTYYRLSKRGLLFLNKFLEELLSLN